MRRTFSKLALVVGMTLMGVLPASAQLTSSGTINATVTNKSGIALVFSSVPGGLTLTNSGTSAVTMDFGSVSAFGTLLAGIGRTVAPTSYEVNSPFYTRVIAGGFTTYSLTATLGAAAPTGIAYYIDAAGPLGAGSTTVVTGQTDFGVDVSRSLRLVIQRASPGSGGPAIGSSSVTITFTATGA